MKQSINDVGWMYHQTPVKKYREPKCYPPLSRIPGLGLTDEEVLAELPPPPNKFKSTDTPYQTLSKLNGRHDLLYHHENSSIKKEPVPYPRCEWFYLDDHDDFNYKKRECSEEMIGKKYEFLVPDYMVSLPFKNVKEKCIDRKTPPPYEKPKQKIIRKKLPNNRPGYAEYTKPPVKTTVANKSYPPDPRLSFPKDDITRCKEKPKKVMEHYYEKDYDEFRRQWNEIKYHEHLREKENRKKEFKEMSRDLNRKLKIANSKRLNSVFPFA